MDIHSNYESIKQMALYYAKKHDTNYNVILSNPVNGEFGEGSTYEFVTDSYFENHKDNYVLLYKTDDDLKHNILQNKEYLDTAKTIFYINL